LEVSNTIHVKENIIVDGSFNFRNYIGNYTSISGEIILSNHVDISNSGSGPALNIYHDVDDDIVLFKNKDGNVFKIDASGNSNFYYDVDVSSLIIEKNTNIEGNVFIHQNLDISNNLVIEGTIYNLQKIDISNNVNIYGNVDILHDYTTIPHAGNKNYFNLDIDGSGLEINIHTTQIDTSNSFRTITTYSYTDISLDVSNISLITYSENIDFSDTTITIIDFSGSHTEIQIGTTTISAESFTDICTNISIPSTIKEEITRVQIDISYQPAGNNDTNHLLFDININNNRTIVDNTTTYLMDTISDISSESTSYTDISKIEVIEYESPIYIIIKIIDISDNTIKQLISTTYNIVESLLIKNYDSPITLNRYQIDICNQDNDGNKYHLSFTTSRDSGPLIDNCFNILTTYEYSNEFHSNIDISINLNEDNSYCFIGRGTMPMSGIIMWSGSELPDGWVYCDGSNGTPDLRGRFIMSSTYSNENITIVQEVGSYNTDQSGGLQRVTLEDEEMPSHSHTIDNYSYNHTHYIDGIDTTTGIISNGGSHTHEFNDITTIRSQGNQGNTFTPKYYGEPDKVQWLYVDEDDNTSNNGKSHRHNLQFSTHQHSCNQTEMTHNHGESSNKGVEGQHENKPPYYVLVYIMRIY